MRKSVVVSKFSSRQIPQHTQQLWMNTMFDRFLKKKKKNWLCLVFLSPNFFENGHIVRKMLHNKKMGRDKKNEYKNE
jgi:hypothetical protein